MSDDSSYSSESSVNSDSSLDELNTSQNSRRLDNLEGSWTFLSHNQRSAQILGNLPHRVLAEDQLQLKYNSVDATLLQKGTAEIKHSLTQIRHHVFASDDRQKIDPLVAFAGALPEQFFKIFMKWLKSGEDNDSSTSPRRTSPRRETPTRPYPQVSFSDIVEYIRCELIMRVLKTSATELARCHAVSAASLAGFLRVRKAMTKADRPASRRPPPNPEVKSAWLPSFTFDPIIYEAIMVCNTHWILIHFLLGVSWLDCDDDKLGHSSQLFKEYGMSVL